MAVAPIAGVLGVVSTVSGMAQQSRQNAINEASIAANQKAADAAAALKRAEVETKRSYANYQSNLNQMTRQTQMMQAEMGLQAQDILSQMQYRDQQASLENSRYQVNSNAIQEQSGALADKTNTELAYGQAMMGANAQSINNQTQLANAAQGTREKGKQGNARRAMVEAVMAATQGVPGRSQDALLQKDVNNDVSSALMEFMNQAGISEQDVAQLAATGDIANLLRQINVSKADFRANTAIKAQQYGNMAIDAALRDAATSRQLDQSGSQQARAQLQASKVMDENSDAVNRILADWSYNLQGQAVQNQLSAQTASLNAQAASTRNTSMLPGLLNAGLQLYQSFGSGGGGQQSTNPLYSNSMSNYGLLTNGTQYQQYQPQQQPDLSAGFSGATTGGWSL